MSLLKNKVTLIIALILSYSGINAQTSLSKLNLAAQYQINPSKELNVYGIKDENDHNLIFVSFKIPEELESVSISFWGAENYKEPVTNLDSLLINEEYLGEDKGFHFYKYTINNRMELVAVEMSTNDEQPSLIKEVYFDKQKLDLALLKINLPVMNRWIYSHDFYNITDFNLRDIDIYASYYSYDFPAASPPMVTKNVDNQELQKDSSFLLFDNIGFALINEGFYLYQKDSTSQVGYGWRLEDEAFPKLNTISKLIPPLKYITTPEEYKSLTDKVSFDKFWLKLAKDQTIARSLIRKFYSRVEHANKYFTTYKEGWKTDMGMVYIVYGPPQEVFRNEDGEIWWYLNDEENISFQFLRFSHVFYPYNYVLLRDSKYRLSWFRKVEQLRNNYF